MFGNNRFSHQISVMFTICKLNSFHKTKIYRQFSTDSSLPLFTVGTSFRRTWENTNHERIYWNRTPVVRAKGYILRAHLKKFDPWRTWSARYTFPKWVLLITKYFLHVDTINQNVPARTIRWEQIGTLSVLIMFFFVTGITHVSFVLSTNRKDTHTHHLCANGRVFFLNANLSVPWENYKGLYVRTISFSIDI